MQQSKSPKKSKQNKEDEDDWDGMERFCTRVVIYRYIPGYGLEKIPVIYEEEDIDE